MIRLPPLRAEWSLWWRTLGPAARWLPLAIAAAYPGIHAWGGGLRRDHLWLAGAALVLYYAGPRLRPLGRFLVPLLLLVAVYDAQRYWVEAWRGPVRVTEPRAWELAWFGLEDGGRRVTPAEWWQTRTHPVLDGLCGVAYLGFMPAFLGMAAWWRFGARSSLASRVLWALLALNLAGYAVYLLYPAAPPWYVDRHGLGPVVLSAAPEAAGAARFDALFGVDWFAQYYGRNANVFGAIPSLHVGQTFLAVLFAWWFRSLRGPATAFWLLVTFASVYLNHHYLVDGLAGMLLAAVVFAGTVGLRGRAAGGAISGGIPGDPRG
jgi:membrane-associated phospholipid phosphatase